MKIFLAGAGAFLFVCLLGQFVMLAGGATWGTSDCGFGWALTFMVAAFLAVGAASVVGAASESK